MVNPSNHLNNKALVEKHERTRKGIEDQLKELKDEQQEMSALYDEFKRVARRNQSITAQYEDLNRTNPHMSSASIRLHEEIEQTSTLFNRGLDELVSGQKRLQGSLDEEEDAFKKACNSDSMKEGVNRED